MPEKLDRDASPQEPSDMGIIVNLEKLKSFMDGMNYQNEAKEGDKRVPGDHHFRTQLDGMIAGRKQMFEWIQKNFPVETIGEVERLTAEVERLKAILALILPGR